MDPYRHSADTVPAPGAAPVAARPDRSRASGRTTRIVLWLLLLVSAAANAITSVSASYTWISLGCGLVTAATVVALIVQYARRHRTRDRR